MATNNNFVVKNGIIVGTTTIVDSSGAWQGAASTYVGHKGLQVLKVLKV